MHSLALLAFHLYFGILLIKLITSLGYQDLPMVAELLYFGPENCIKIIKSLVSIVLDTLHLDLVQ
jgi:hypothetical protein